MSILSKIWKKNYPGMRKAWTELRESPGGVGLITSTLGTIFAPLAVLGPLFRKETEPGSGVYEPNLINPVSVTVAGIVLFLGYKIYKKKK